MIDDRYYDWVYMLDVRYASYCIKDASYPVPNYLSPDLVDSLLKDNLIKKSIIIIEKPKCVQYLESQLDYFPEYIAILDSTPFRRFFNKRKKNISFKSMNFNLIKYIYAFPRHGTKTYCYFDLTSKPIFYDLVQSHLIEFAKSINMSSRGKVERLAINLMILVLDITRKSKLLSRITYNFIPLRKIIIYKFGCITECKN